MIYSEQIQKAIRFSTKTHEVYQKQKRKGKDIPYITHPLIVGLILSRAGASEDVIVAGILHDTIEDSVAEKKVTVAMVEERFGPAVAQMVSDVTEHEKSLPWDVRKQQALEHIPDFSHDSLLVKAADVISNVSDLIQDIAEKGDSIFESFNGPKENTISRYLGVIRAVRSKWPESPLVADLNKIEKTLSEFVIL